jgi:hypothetical protein
MLTKWVDPKTLGQMADWLHARYTSSALADMQRMGTMGPSSLTGAVDRARMYDNPARAMAKKNFLSHTSSFVNDIFHAIGSAPGSSIIAMNKNLVRDPEQAWKVAATIRNFTGDPGKSGAFAGKHGKAAAGMVNATPWGNVFIQSTAKLISALSNPETAGKTLLNIGYGIGIPTVMASLWNANQGPEFVEHQHFNRSADDHFANIYLGIPGHDPTQGLEVPIDPVMRPFKAIFEGLTGAYLGLFSGQFFHPANADMQGVINDAVNHRYFSLGKGSLFHSFLTQTVLPPPPPLLQGLAAAAGLNLNSWVDANTAQNNKRAGFVAGSMPDPARGMNSEVMSGHFEDVLRGLGANGFAAMWHMLTGIVKDTSYDAPLYLNKQKSLGEAVNYQLQEWKERAKESMVGGTALFGSYRAVTPSQEASSSVAKEKLDGIRSIAEAAQSVGTSKFFLGNIIGNRKQGYEQLVGATPRMPNSVEEQQFAYDVTQFYKELQPTIHDIKMAYNQRQSIMNDNTMDPEQKRLWMNRVSYNIIDTHRRMIADISRIENVLSQRYGTKIDFAKMQRGALSDPANPTPIE